MATGTSANTGNNVILVRTAMISLLMVLAWCLVLGFNATRVPLPSFVVWLMAIGSIGNPTVFLLLALGPKTHLTELWLFTTASISITTAGYGMAAIRFIRSTLPPSA